VSVGAVIEGWTGWLAGQGGPALVWALDAGKTYGLHLVFLATVAGCAVLLRRLHRLAVDSPEPDPEHLFHGSRATSPQAVLFPYEAAYLAGGPGRVAETALAALVEEGWVEATPSGRLRRGSGGESVELPDPVATGVLAAVPGDRQTAATEVWHRAVRLREVLDVGGILYARRLLVSKPAKRRLRRLRWAATGVLAAAGCALLLTAVTRSPRIASPPVVAAAAALALGLVAPALVGRRRLFRTARGEVELFSLVGSVCAKARWVARRVWSDEAEAAVGGVWTDVDRIVVALQRPPAGRPHLLAELWGREDAQMAVAVRGLRGITDRGLRRGLDGGARAAVKRTPSTALSTPVHNMVRPDDS
jgi:uncharacterized protein (TIGR04222 family)